MGYSAGVVEPVDVPLVAVEATPETVGQRRWSGLRVMVGAVIREVHGGILGTNPQITRRGDERRVAESAFGASN